MAVVKTVAIAALAAAVAGQTPTEAPTWAPTAAPVGAPTRRTLVPPLPLSCGNPITDPTTTELASTPAYTGSFYLQTAGVQCRAGYQNAGGTSIVTRSCTAAANGAVAWDQDITCTRLVNYCPLPTLTNAEMAPGCDRGVGGACSAVCSTGYTAVGADAVTYTCNAGTASQGSMTSVGGTDIRCTRVQCDLTSLRSAVDGLGVDVPSGGTLVFGTPYTATCATGFALDETAVARVPWRCVGTNTWASGAVVCRPVTCGSPLSGDNQVIVRMTSASFGSVATVGCRPGFGQASVQRQCQADGSWSGSVLCTRSPGHCGTGLAVPSAANARFNVGCARQVDQACVASCSAGYAGAAAAYRCTESGDMAPEASPVRCTRVSCSRASLLAALKGRGVVEPGSQPSYDFGSAHTAQCASGFAASQLVAGGALGRAPTFRCTAPDAWAYDAAAGGRCVPTVGVDVLPSSYFRGPSFAGAVSYLTTGSWTATPAWGTGVGVVAQQGNRWAGHVGASTAGVGDLRVVVPGTSASWNGGLEYVRVVASTSASTLTLQNTDVTSQISSGRVRAVPQSAILQVNLAPFVASGGSGQYAFVGTGHCEVGGSNSTSPSGCTSVQWQRVPGTTNQYRLAGPASLMVVGRDYRVSITVIDAVYGTWAELSLRISATQSLVGSFEPDARFHGPAIATSDSARRVQVTEGSPFAGVIRATGTTTQAAAAATCAVVVTSDPAIRGGAGSSCSGPQGQWACPPSASSGGGQSVWLYGLPGGVTLTAACQINGTLENNGPFPAFVDGVSTIEFRAVIRVAIPQAFGGDQTDIRVSFKVNAPLTVRVVRGSSAVVLAGAELVDTGSSYSAVIDISGGQQPYYIPPESVQLPPGLRIERVYRISGTPAAETVNNATGAVVAEQFAFEVEETYLGTGPVTETLWYKIGAQDCANPANGPNGNGCGPNGTCVDDDDASRFDRAFACSCVHGFQGDNCGEAVALVGSEASGGGGSDGSDTTWVLVAMALLVIAAVVVFFTYSRHQRRLLNKPFDFEAEMKKRLEDGGFLASLAAVDKTDGGEPALKVPKELKRKNIVMLDKLGSGAFGDVNKGLYNPEIAGVPEFGVAIKLLKDQPTREERDELMKEATVSAQFSNEHVVMCVGVVTAGTPVLLVLQLCDKGSLHALLKKDGAALTVDNKGKYCLHTCLGMDYLASLGFVHRDLAARNVLVDGKDCAKIADFGLSRDTEDSDYYVAKAGKVPIRWTAPEALSARKFSEASDVWAYAITCVEIWTNAQTPYKGWMNAFVLEQVLEGYIHPRPPDCPEGFYDRIVVPSLSLSPKMRPNFARLAGLLVGFFGSAEWARVAGGDGQTTAEIAAFKESVTAGARVTSRYKDVDGLSPPCPEFAPQVHREVYCGNCFKKNCQKNPRLQGLGEGCEMESVQSSLSTSLEALPMNHGRIDNDEAMLRLREPLPDVAGEVEKSFPELKRWLMCEDDNRTVRICILSSSTYGTHVLEFGDDMKWRERGYEGVASFGSNVLGAALSFLDSIDLGGGKLLAVECDPERKSVNSLSSNLSSTDLASINGGGGGGGGGTSGKRVTQYADAEVSRTASFRSKEDVQSRWWAGDLPKNAVRATVRDAGSGTFMIRPSSRDRTVVLVLNDNGRCVDYPISWDASARRWAFVGQKFASMHALIDMLRVEPLSSKWGGYDVFLLSPAPGGAKIDLEMALFGVSVAKPKPARRLRRKVGADGGSGRSTGSTGSTPPDNGLAGPRRRENRPPPAPPKSDASGRTESLLSFGKAGGDDPDADAEQDDYELPSAEGAVESRRTSEAFDGFEDGGSDATPVPVEAAPGVPEVVAVAVWDEGGAAASDNSNGNDDDDDDGAAQHRDEHAEPLEDANANGGLDGDDGGGFASAALGSDDMAIVVNNAYQEELTVDGGVDDDSDDDGGAEGGDADGATHAALTDEGPVYHKAAATEHDGSGVAPAAASGGTPNADDKNSWWAGKMTKAQVSSAVKAGTTGSFMLRRSRDDNQVILVVNDFGTTVSYPIVWNAADGSFTFATRSTPTLESLVDAVRHEKIRSKATGETFQLGAPAAPRDGARFDFQSWRDDVHAG